MDKMALLGFYVPEDFIDDGFDNFKCFGKDENETN